MAKPPADQECIFCSPDPCDCNTSKKKSTLKKRVKKESAPSSATPASENLTTTPPSNSTSAPGQAFDVRAAMKAAALSSPTVDTSTSSSLGSDGHHATDLSSRRLLMGEVSSTLGGEVERSELEENLQRAIYNARSILHESELSKYASIIRSPRLRAEEWKKSNGL